MATKASGTLVLIIEKQHAPWGRMVTALPGLGLHFRCQLRIASARYIRLSYEGSLRGVHAVAHHVLARPPFNLTLTGHAEGI